MNATGYDISKLLIIQRYESEKGIKMKITEHIYQISGTSYGTNSSNYVLDAGDRLILFDAGYSDFQMEIMRKNLKIWKLDRKPITHTFLTHVHMDHAANAAKLKEMGSTLLIGAEDAQTMENGGPETLDKLFGRSFSCCKPDILLKDGDTFKFGTFKITCIALPGHTPGSMGYLVEDVDVTCFVTGDFVALGPVSPDETEQEVLLAAMIKPGFSEHDYGESLKKACNIPADILLTGHYTVYYGDVKKIFKKAYDKFSTEKLEIMEI